MLIPSWGLEPLADRDVVALHDMGMVTGQRGGLGAEGTRRHQDGPGRLLPGLSCQRFPPIRIPIPVSSTTAPTRSRGVSGIPSTTRSQSRATETYTAP